VNFLEHNRQSWNTGVMSASVWAQPVDATTIAAARAGQWDVLLTPKTQVPKAWFCGIEGKTVHSLASQIGGQTDAGFLIAGLYEDHWFDDTWAFSNRSPVSIATRALRPR
jgi:hypothetical protein